MKYEDLIFSHLLNQPVYVPGKPIEAVAREYGLDVGNVYKLASNEGPWGCSPKVKAALTEMLDHTNLYPDGSAHFLRAKLARFWNLSQDQFLIGAGSNEILEFIGHLFLDDETEAVFSDFSFPVYGLVTMMFGAKPVPVPMKNYANDFDALLAAVTERTRVVFVASPNNPTGPANSANDILAFARALPEHVVLVFDEAYAEYLDEQPDMRELVREGRKVVCLRTFSKIYGLAQLRVGYAYASKEFISFLQRVRQPFNVNGFGLRAAEVALEDQDFVTFCREFNRKERARLTVALTGMGFSPIPSAANFILFPVRDAEGLFSELQSKGVIVRPTKHASGQYMRVSVGKPEQNAKFLELMELQRDQIR